MSAYDKDRGTGCSNREGGSDLVRNSIRVVVAGVALRERRKRRE